jgi:effector-binding domain-containing protein
MIEPPQVVQTTAQHSAVIHVVVPCDEIQDVIGPTIREVYGAIGAQGVAPAGPWFTHHRRRPTDTFDLEVSVPVVSAIKPAGRVQPGQWPAMKVARTVYHGGYEGLGEAWMEFIDWIEAQGLNAADDLWECYLVGPETRDDSALYRTQLSKPLIG